MSTIAIERGTIKTKSIATALAVIAAVALPQLVHLAGGAAAGTALLPMQLPVFLAAFLAGPLVGLLAGLLSPIVSFAVAGMPTAVLLPVMMLELAGYGLVAGWLGARRKPETVRGSFVQVFAAQVCGRAVRVLTVLFFVYVLQNEAYAPAQAYQFLRVGLPGMALQLVLLPLLLPRLCALRKTQ